MKAIKRRKYLQLKTEFNPGTLKYEPVLPSTKSENKKDEVNKR